MTRTDTLKEIKSWSLDDRVELINEVWDSIADDNGIPKLTDDLRAEFDHRIAAYEADPGNVVSWEQIEASLDREP